MTERVEKKTMSDRIQQWWPKGVEATPEVMSVVVATKEAAVAAKMRKRVDMTAMRSMFDFYLWAEKMSLPIEVVTATPENVEAFIADELAERSPASLSTVRWSLDCFTGRKEFNESKKAADARTPGKLLPETRKKRRNFSPAADIVAAIADWQPKDSLDESRWAQVAEAVRQLVKLSDPVNVGEAETRMDQVSLLAAWADHYDLPLRHDLLLSPENIKRFLEDSGYSVSSKRVIRSSLNVTAKCVNDRKFAQARRNQKSERPLTHPYSPAESAAIRSDCAKVSTEKRRRHLSALFDLCEGVGVGGGLEAACVTPADIRTEDGYVVVDVWKQPIENREKATPQPRPARADAGERLLKLAAEAIEAGDKYLIGGNNMVSRRNRRPSELCNATAEWSVSLRTERARLTWLVRVLDEPVHLLAVIDHLDLVSIQSFEAVVPFLTAKPKAVTWPYLTQ